MSEQRRRRRKLDSEERALWDKIAQTVAPLASHMRQVGADLASARQDEPLPPPFADSTPSPQKAPMALTPVPDDAALEALWQKGIGGHGKASPDRPTKSGLLPLEHGTSPGVDRRTADRFRKGRMTVDGRLDLHGMTQEQAHSALHSFIERAAANGLRCLLVITGKGMRGEGVLRRMVPRWLNDSRLRPLILSFSHAQIPDGGDGALYVLVKRRRAD
jgi:DNA-nicking Smr family endonuclease